MQRMQDGRRRWRQWLLAAVALIGLTLAMAAPAAGEGSADLFDPLNPGEFRSNMEWRTSRYGGGDSADFNLLRRTLLRIYAQAGESILVASSGIGAGAPNLGDIRVFNPDVVPLTPIGDEPIPALAGPVAGQPGVYANGFSCVEQRTAAGDGRGRIGTRAQETAGPLPAAGGYAPCVYTAPVTGIYALVYTGPAGPNSDVNPQISGRVNAVAADFGPNQQTSVTAWDARVRNSAGGEPTGRLFTYYYAANTGGGNRPISAGQGYVVTDSGFQYAVTFSGDPFGYVFFANQLGFRDGDGNPLYRNLLADPRAPTQDQNQLRDLQGDVSLLPPDFPLFFNRPDPLTLTALGIPLNPVPPTIRNLSFAGPTGGNSTGLEQGGTFSFETTEAGVYYVVVSGGDDDFDPTLPTNRVLRGVAAEPGVVTVQWDGLNNAGDPFPVGEYSAQAAVQGGEVHFPFLDVENNADGGPVIELLNPPDTTRDGVGDCPPWAGGCFGAFYDDRGYETGGVLVGQSVNGPLCRGDAQNPRGFGNPPLIAASDPEVGFDSRTNQRAFGFRREANPSTICVRDGGFGDKKALDLWTYYPSNELFTPLRIIDLTAVTLRSFTANRTADGVELRWETGVELNTAGFHVLRSASGAEADAVRVTPALITARGNSSGGASYSFAVSVARDQDRSGAYWLEELETNGTVRRYGPVRPRAGAADGQFRVGLPLLRQ